MNPIVTAPPADQRTDIVTRRDLDACLDTWLEVRVQAHQAREVKAIGVPRYLELLCCVRAVEDVLDPWRRELGAGRSRAFELVTTDEQLELVAA